ncbi:helix-turn-helix domain-containing protein [Chryseolinea lacunae]|uniref:Helix-turn-helix domain-containing protein n=1 Tax=Chryseolinea lacunae TaxID=2801331 RepID=A0ABS1L2D3_9BACT|nr:helix-turn-helix domain-containing protein [Chryseolinea lacunae]MBL0745677.1 helix-turn-helix domain-containing protein [Chryseolinea lacunae]
MQRKNLTRQNTEQHIYNHVIEKTRELLTRTNLSVSEIAFELRVYFPQSLNKLFKNKTGATPLHYRNSFN